MRLARPATCSTGSWRSWASVRGDRADAGSGQGRRPGEDRSAGCRKLARCYRSGDLTAVWVPDEGSEALRDLVRAREAAKQDQLRAATG